MCDPEGPIAHSAQCVYRNALFLSYMAYKAMVDGDSHPKAIEMVAKIPGIFQEDWMDDLTLDLAEQRFVNAPFGTLKQQQRAEASWLTERMAVLAWALGIAELPPFYHLVHAPKVSTTLGIFQPGAKERVAKAKLRHPDDVVMAAKTYSALYWRLSEHIKDPNPIDFYNRMLDPENHHLTVDGLQFHEGDLAINGVPLNQLPEEKLGLTCSIVFQRYKELRWLLGLNGVNPQLLQ